MPNDNIPRESRSVQHDDLNRRRVLKAAAAGAASMVGVAGAATASEDGDVGTDTHVGNCCLECVKFETCEQPDGTIDICHFCECFCDDDGGLQ